MAVEQKSVLVCFHESKRAVSFPCCESPIEEREAFLEVVHHEFVDLLPSPPPPLIIQLKDEEWGEFVDVTKSAKIPHHCIVKLILAPSASCTSTSDIDSASASDRTRVSRNYNVSIE